MVNIERSEISPQRKLALVGMGMFIDVSRQHPANFVAQGADIAMRCKVKELDPKTVENALKENEDLIQKLVKTANKSHKNNGPKKVGPRDVIGVIEDDFGFASSVMHLDTSDIALIMSPEYKIIFLTNANYLKRSTITPETVKRIAKISWVNSR